MKEQAVNFGAASNLAGVLCEPDASKAVPNAPVALLWNVGIHHHVGSYRVWVDLARRLAADGFTSLRFDLSGMGDSDIRPGSDGSVTRSEDLDDAMDLVTRRTGAKTFAPMGFCSGVDQLHPLGLRDPRVVAMGYIEAYVWKTRGYYARYPLRYLRGTLWKNRVEGFMKARAEKKQAKALGEGLKVDPMAAQEAQGGLFARDYPTKEKFRADLDALMNRGVKLFFGYFGLDTGITHQGQFEEMTGLKPSAQLALHFQGGADHILYRTADRAVALGEITAWLKRSYPVG